jgi:hypothetical protein
VPVTGATMKNEIIIDCGVEGSAWTLLGRRGTRGGWRFRVIRNEGTLKDFIDAADWDCFEFHHETAWVVGWESALTLFDEYSWHTFYPVRVHPDFAGRIWAAVRERLDAATHHEDDCARDNLKRWYRLCHGVGAGISGMLFERANLIDDLAAVLTPEQRRPASMSRPPSPAAPPPQRPAVIPALLLVMLLGKDASAIAEKPEAKRHRGERSLTAEITTPAADQPCTVMPPDIAAAARELLREHRDQRYGILADLVWKDWCLPDGL